MTFLQISDELQSALMVDPDDPKGEPLEVLAGDHSIASAFGRHLGVGWPHGDAAIDLLMHFVRAVDRQLRFGAPQEPNKWVQSLVESGLRDLSYDELHNVVYGFGWSRQRIEGSPRIEELEEVFRSLVASKFQPKLFGLVTRWRSEGIFDLAADRGKMRRRPDPQLLRDSARAPRYAPPSRS